MKLKLGRFGVIIWYLCVSSGIRLWNIWDDEGKLCMRMMVGEFFWFV